MSRSSSELFSKAAVDRLASPEQIDQLLTFGSPTAWVTLAALLAGMGAAIAWGVEGRVATSVAAQGILMRAGGLDTVDSLAEGQVETVQIAPGDTVQPGQIIATLIQPQRSSELLAARAAVTDLERQRASLQSIHTGQSDLQVAAFEKQRSTIQRETADLEQQAKRLTDQLNTEHGLLAKGLITRSQSVATEQQLAHVQTELNAKAAELSRLTSERFQSVNAGRPETLNLDEQIASAQHHAALLQDELQASSAVRSTVSGQVVTVNARPGMLLHEGAPVIEVQQASSALHALVYVPAAKAKQIQQGMRVEISPSGLKREEYGFLRGTVEHVSEFPVDTNTLTTTLENTPMVQQIVKTGPVSEVDVALSPIPGHPGQFQWSSARGQELQLTAGSLLTGEVVINEQSPASLVIPSARHALGLR